MEPAGHPKRKNPTSAFPYWLSFQFHHWLFLSCSFFFFFLHSFLSFLINMIWSCSDSIRISIDTAERAPLEMRHLQPAVNSPRCSDISDPNEIFTLAWEFSTKFMLNNGRISPNGRWLSRKISGLGGWGRCVPCGAIYRVHRQASVALRVPPNNSKRFDSTASIGLFVTAGRFGNILGGFLGRYPVPSIGN